MRAIAILFAICLALLAGPVACGGDDDDTTQPAPAETPTGTSGGDGTTGGDAATGADVFASAGCANCHTLAAANASGNVGPNLDDLQPDFDTVVAQVTSGGGGMPAFGDQLGEQEIADVAAFVSENAGN